jgi:hypothetical protein
MDECLMFLTRQTSVCGELVMVYSVDGRRWFSHKRDLRRFETRRAKLEKSLSVLLRPGVTLGRFQYDP